MKTVAVPITISSNALILLILWTLLICSLVIVAPAIATGSTITTILQFSSILALVSLGQAFVILCGGSGIDLSVGGIVSLTCVFSLFLIKVGFSPILLPLVAPLIGGFLGWINGFLIAKLRLLPLIVTLGTFYTYSGLALSLTGGSAQLGVPAWLIPWGRGTVLGAPYSFLATAVPAFVVAGIVLWFTSWGRWIYAVGYNEASARLVGIPVDRIRLYAYSASGFFAGVAALVSMAWLGSGRPNIGQNLEIESLTAALLGGIGIGGGSGGFIGVLAAALFLVTLKTGLQFINVSSVWQVGLTGVLLVAIVSLSCYRKQQKI